METFVQINTKYVLPFNLYDLIPEREELEKIQDSPKLTPIANKRIIRIDTFPDDEINFIRRNYPYWASDYFDDNFLGETKYPPKKKEDRIVKVRSAKTKVCLRTAGVTIEQFYKIIPPREHLNKLENLPPLFEYANSRLIFIMGYLTGKESWEEVGTYEVVDLFDSKKAGIGATPNLREEVIHIKVNEVMNMH